MYCPQCGNESPAGLQYCRACGSNLKVIGKAVALSEAIARSDWGPLPKIKEMVKNLKVDHVTEEVSRALEHMNKEIVRISPNAKSPHRPWWVNLKKKTPEERRENHIVKGTVSFFSGIGLTIFLYYLSAAIVLKLPPEAVAQIPFEIESVVRVIWLVGLVPTLTGVGHIIAGLLIKSRPPTTIYQTPIQQDNLTAGPTAMRERPFSVTERTTNLLEHEELSEDSTH